MGRRCFPGNETATITTKNTHNSAFIPTVIFHKNSSSDPIISPKKKSEKEDPQTITNSSINNDGTSKTNIFFDSEANGNLGINQRKYEYSDQIFNYQNTTKSITKEEAEHPISAIASPKVLIKELEKIYSSMKITIPKRDRLHNNLIKSLRKYLQEDFINH